MAFFGSSFLLVALSVAFFFTNVPTFAEPGRNITDAEISTICSKTLSPSFCSRVLTNKTLHANQTDLHGLAKISIGLALAFANETHAAIDPLIKAARNYNEREGYVLCSKNYEEAIHALRDAQRMLSKQDYRGVRVEALAAAAEAKACEHDVGIPSSPYNPSPLQEKNKNFNNYCNIIWAITNRLVE
ncbi:hypothetical protein DITRI_Ditri20bG0111400 [Diplodiscus trichospermus]